MKLRQLRKQKNLTLRDLEAMTGISRMTIQKIETGATKNPSYARVLIIADALGVKPEELFHKRITFEA
jgi:transcriptional regulator with XRE-family HTH domain